MENPAYRRELTLCRLDGLSSELRVTSLASKSSSRECCGYKSCQATAWLKMYIELASSRSTVPWGARSFQVGGFKLLNIFSFRFSLLASNTCFAPSKADFSCSLFIAQVFWWFLSAAGRVNVRLQEQVSLYAMVELPGSPMNIA